MPRAALESIYPGDYRTVDGVRLRLCDTGRRDAGAVILLHGFGSSLDTLEPWAQALSERYRVVRFDLPGFGLTGPDPTGDYTDAREMKILIDLMDQLGIIRASLIGNSLGGRIAWSFTAQHSDRVGRLVLISPDGFASPGFAYDVSPKTPLIMRFPALRLAAQPFKGQHRRRIWPSGSFERGHPDPLSLLDIGTGRPVRDSGAHGSSRPARSYTDPGSHSGSIAPPLGRKGRHDPYQQRGRLPATSAPRNANAAGEPRKCAIRGGSGGLPCPRGSLSGRRGALS